MNKRPNPNHQPTDAELIDAIIKNALAQGFDYDECRGLILAESANGILRPNAPKWLRQTQYFLAVHEKLYTADLLAKASDQWLSYLDRLHDENPQPEPGAHRGASD